MKQSLRTISFLFTGLFATALISGCDNGGRHVPGLENRHIQVTLSEDLARVSSFLDIKRNREYIHLEDQVPLFRIGIAGKMGAPEYVNASHTGIKGDPDSLEYLTPENATKSSWKKTDHGLELNYWFRDPEGMKVTCRLEAPENDSLIYWGLTINPGADTVTSIQYPILGCTDKIQVTPSEGGIVYPEFEGSLMKNVYKPGFQLTKRYPGSLSSQLLYFFDREGGIYYAAHDGNGYQKNLSIRRRARGSISMNQEYLTPAGLNSAIEMPYRVATGCYGGRWEQGAEVYRSWSDKQKWAAKTISERDIPDYLKNPTFWINIAFPAEEFRTPEKTDGIVQAYRQYFEIPIVVTAFGWEKQGTWIGPDYFPPVYGWDYYRALAATLRERGDHLHVYTSGFRVAVEAAEGTEFDGYDEFNRDWKASSATVPSGDIAMERRPWAKNYMLCIGDTGATSMLAGIYEELFRSGISGVDLDQNLSGELADCYNSVHGHPAGPGRWQSEALQRFLQEVRSTGKKISNQNFTGMEEPCEYYIPELDVAHCRAFASTAWPALKGGISIPLFLYLYHPYQINYAGWIHMHFSPLKDERLGIGRAFIFGMAPGVRVQNQMALPAREISLELRMLKGYTRLFSLYPDHLIRGRMIGEIDFEGAPYFKTTTANGGDSLMSGWKDVQGICWSKADGNDPIIAVSNLSDARREVKMKPDPGLGTRFKITGYVQDVPVNSTVERNADGTVSLSLDPWQLAVVEPAD